MRICPPTQTFNIITCTQLKDLARENYYILDYDWFNLNSDSLSEYEYIGHISGILSGRRDDIAERNLRNNNLQFRYSGDTLLNMLVRDEYLPKGNYIIKND